MAIEGLKEYLNLMPVVARSPQQLLWLSYDREADVLYVNYRKPSVATDSELTEDDIILRYDGEELVGMTVLHASQR